jgi:hypothetical protein
MSDELREKIAELCHDQWSGWMCYLFRFGTTNDDGTFTMDAEKVARWRRQASMRYDELPEFEKDSDRKEADKFLRLMR